MVPDTAAELLAAIDAPETMTGPAEHRLRLAVTALDDVAATRRAIEEARAETLARRDRGTPGLPVWGDTLQLRWKR
jgi:hypothetical protein